MHIAGFGATHWSSLNRIVRTVFLEIEFQNKTWGQTERQTEGADDRDFRNYSMMFKVANPYGLSVRITEFDLFHTLTAVGPKSYGYKIILRV